MPKQLTLDMAADEGLRELLGFLLRSGRVSGVFTLSRLGAGNPVAYSLITDPAGLDAAVPLFPLMPANMGKQLSRLTSKQAAGKPVAAVLRPCELRAFVELLKRNEGSLENFLVISSTCGGVYPTKMAAKENIADRIPAYWDAVKQGELPADLRSACAACEYCVPFGADMTLNLVGNEHLDRQCEITLNTDKAEESVQGIEGELTETPAGADVPEAHLAKRRAQRAGLLDEIGGDAFDVERVFGNCIGCRACSKSCPICYCEVCYFESGGSDHGSQYYDTQLAKSGLARVLPDTTLYQLVRLFHVSASCVGCGACADVCPADLPLSAVSLKVAGAVQQAFDYLPGRDIEEGIPVITYIPEEFAGMQ